MAAYDESKLHSLIAQWEMGQASGRRITPEELCKDTPELLEEFCKKLEQLRQFPASDETSPFDDKPIERNGIARTSATLPTIPNYRIEGILGRGGMGVVYKAVQLPLNRTVALKMILSGEHASSDERLRFLAEAEAIAKLQHPGIVQIYDFNTHGNHPFFAMEYLTGGSLDKKLNGTPLPPKEAALLVQKLAEAMQAAHEQGIVHRDLKPANILITSNGQPKITDFGLAKTGGSNLTATGKVVGTPSYMSPEQAEGKKEVGPATDIYALGAILYECLSGRPPFKAATPIDTVLQVIKDEPVSIRQLQPNIPIDLETICHKCLQKDNAKRYGSAKELAEDLGRYLNQEPIHARPIWRVERAVKWVKRHRTLTIAALTTAAALLVGLGLALWQAKVASAEAERASQEAQRANNEVVRAVHAEKQAEERADAIAKEKQKNDRLYALQMNSEGLRLMERGDHFTGMLCFTQPLTLRSLDTKLEHITRERLGATRYLGIRRHYCSQILTHQQSVTHAVLSPDNHRLVTTSGQTAQIWDTHSGLPLASPIKHKSDILFVAFNANGLRIVTASADNTSRVWDAISGHPLSPPMLHESSVIIASFSPNGNRVVTASGRSAHVWDAVSAEAVTPSLDHTGDVLHVSFSPDGRHVVTATGGGVGGTSDHIARVWDARSGKSITPPLVHRDWVSYATFSPDNRWVLTACYDNRARIWDAVTGTLIHQSIAHRNQLYQATFSPDGRRVVTASGDNSARVWDAFSGVPVTPPLLHQDRVIQAVFSPDGRRIITASLDNTVRMWSANTGHAISPPLMHCGSVTHATFSRDSRLIVTASKDKAARIWDIADSIAPTRFIHLGDVLHASFSPDGRYVVTSSRDKTSRVWDSLNAQPISPPLLHLDEVLHAAFSPDGSKVVTASRDNTARIWDSLTGQPITQPLRHKHWVTHATFSPDGRLIVTASMDKSACVWDVDTGQPISQPITHQGRLSVSYVFKNHASFNPNGRRIVTSLGDGTSQVWDTGSGNPVLPPLVHNEQVFHASFSPDGRHIVTASADKSARVWDAESGVLLVSFFLHQDMVFNATFSPDSRHIVTISADKTARVWDAKTGKPVTPPLNHGSQVNSARFSSDGLRLVTTSGWAVYVWDVASGQLVTPRLSHEDYVNHASFSPDGRKLLTASKNYAILRELPFENRPTHDLLKLSQVYAGHKVDDVNGLQPLDVEKELIPWYNEMKAKYPDEFIPKYEDTRRWRLNQIEASCKERNLPAALFHQNWLLAEAVLEAAKNKASSK